jgi:hypothetical protein
MRANSLYDEKWFWGMVARRDVNACDELGVDPGDAFKAHHKSHTNKVMVVAITGFAFKATIENGGVSVKLGCYHAQSHKIAWKEQMATVIQSDGSRKQCGPITRRKGDKWLVDCAVTGTT